MSLLEKIINFLKSNMTRPIPYGSFHITCMVIMVIIITILIFRKKYHNEKQLKIILGTYGIISLIFEVLKQIIWSFNYDNISNIITWDYQWYAFPFQLCTTPIYVTVISLFMKKGKIRNSLLSYIAYITILGSITTMLIPDNCFVNEILVNIHTMWLHLGSLVVSVYLLISGEVKINIKSLITAILVFLIFVGIAEFMNVFIYNIGILNGETFNMFYISPYFESSLPIFDILQKNLPYILYLLIYICILITGGVIIYALALVINKIIKKY